MNEKFENYKAELKRLIADENTDSAHIDADKLLMDIAISASLSEINNEETKELVALYDEVDKWYY